MKKILLTFLSIVFTLSPFTLVSPAYAAVPAAISKVSLNPTRAAKIEARLTTRETNLKTRADKEIDRRIDALNKINTRLTSIKHITDSQKAAFSAQIQTEIDTLTTLKTKIDADTDATTLLADVQSIVKDYRVFALFIPQIELVAAADRVLNVADDETTLAGKLQTRITDASNGGKDVTALQTSFTDMQNKIADSKTQANAAIAAVLPLTPAGYPGNSSVLQNARKTLQAARLDLVTAGKDAKTIIKGLRTTVSPIPKPTH